MAADVLASNAMILQALIEGGWNNEKEEEEEEEEKDDEADDLGSLEHPMTQSILNTKPEQEMVQSALDSQTVSAVTNYITIRTCGAFASHLNNMADRER